VEVRAASVRQLAGEDAEKYKVAVGLGTRVLLLHVENVVESLVSDPAAVPNLVIDKKKKDMGTYDAADPQNHSKWRYSAYRALATKLGLQGTSSVPLPLVCETLVKVCWPGPPKAAYTGYTATGAKRRAEEVEPAVTTDAQGNVVAGTILPPLKVKK